MSKQNRHQLDLLQQRRISNNTKKSSFLTLKRLKRRGFIIGFTISMIGISLCIYTAYRTYNRIKYKDKLIAKAGEYELLKEKYNTNLKSLKSIYKTNNQIAKGIVGTRSSSAFLSEIKQIMPSTIQLDSITSYGDNLRLVGLANQPKALDYINSLKLQVSNSFLINNQSTFLVQASESYNKDKKSLIFELSSSFSNINAKEIMANYEKLGSFGLLKRVLLLYKEGLIK
tara:strand:- start:2995 stop:3678 length:684 start_codon:yes stop_codon:yes gene_type:complete